MDCPVVERGENCDDPCGRRCPCVNGKLKEILRKKCLEKKGLWGLIPLADQNEKA